MRTQVGGKLKPKPKSACPGTVEPPPISATHENIGCPRLLGKAHAATATPITTTSHSAERERKVSSSASAFLHLKGELQHHRLGSAQKTPEKTKKHSELQGT